EWSSARRAAIGRKSIWGRMFSKSKTAFGGGVPLISPPDRAHRDARGRLLGAALPHLAVGLEGPCIGDAIDDAGQIAGLRLRSSVDAVVGREARPEGALRRDAQPIARVAVSVARARDEADAEPGIVAARDVLRRAEAWIDAGLFGSEVVREA